MSDKFFTKISFSLSDADSWRFLFLKKIFFILVVFLALQNTVFAGAGGGLGRVRSCDPMISTTEVNSSNGAQGLDFDPTTGGEDVEFVMSNPICLSVIGYAYANTKIAINNMNAVCQSGSPVPRYMPSPLLDFIDITRATVKAPIDAASGNFACGGALAQSTAHLFRTVAILGGIYEAAKTVYNDASVCGSNWKTANPVQYLNNNPNYKAAIEKKINDIIKRNDKDEIAQKLNFSNKDYREWYYGGIEVDDSDNNDSETCRDVASFSESFNAFGASYDDYPAQKYYLRGYDTGNFNCQRYDVLPGQQDPNKPGEIISEERLAQFQKAYSCCQKRAQSYMCINYSGVNKFCRSGSKCTIKGIVFETKPRDSGALICAQTYSLCPYNFYLGGGSAICDYYQDGTKDENGKFVAVDVENVEKGDCGTSSEIRNPDCTYNNKAGKCKNYCQYMRHCTKTNNLYKYRSTLTSPYFSQACLDFVGDSRNRVSYDTGFIAGSARHFSAPIAQCFKETLENVFYNRAGHTKCFSASGDINGNCSDGVAYTKGEKVEEQTFFSRLQARLHEIVKLVLTLSIIFYGVKIIFARGEIKKKDLLLYIIKLGIVLFFATGFAWQKFFFDGVYNSSTVLSQMVFKLQMDDDESKRDGCQFGVTTDSKGAPILSGVTYPNGKEYLAIWDSLDCKIARYLGFGAEVSTANLAGLILAGFITGSVGIYFAVSLFIFAFLLISATIRALHIFLSASIAILLMVYVSPLTITAMLFKKTEGVFKNWLKQLISFIFQPIILFAYIAIFLTITDKTLIGSASFYGEPPSKKLYCSKHCVDANGVQVDSGIEDYKCDKVGERYVKPKSDSFACIIQTDQYSDWPGLEIIGISLPFIVELFIEDADKKILTILKAVLIMYFLNQFMGEIPKIASQLIGGEGLPQSTADAQKMLGGAARLLRGIQKRGARGGANAAGAAASRAKELANRAAQDGNKGKSVEESGGKEGDDRVGNDDSTSDNVDNNSKTQDSVDENGGDGGDGVDSDK